MKICAARAVSVVDEDHRSVGITYRDALKFICIQRMARRMPHNAACDHENARGSTRAMSRRRNCSNLVHCCLKFLLTPRTERILAAISTTESAIVNFPTKANFFPLRFLLLANQS